MIPEGMRADEAPATFTGTMSTRPDTQLEATEQARRGISASPYCPRLRAYLAVVCVLSGPVPGLGASDAERKRPVVQRDFQETVLADFEHALEGGEVTKDDRVTFEADDPKAPRGAGCLRIELTAEAPVVLRFPLPEGDLTNHDWLEYDVVGAPPEGVLIETTLEVEERPQPVARLATAIDASPWRGQILLEDFVRGGEQPGLTVAFRLTALGAKASLRFDALRLVRDRPPKLPEGLGGTFDFGRPDSAVWPGFTVVDAQVLRQAERGWQWDAQRHPEASHLGWPDPLARDFVGAGPIHTRDPAFVMSLQLRPGQYEGLIIAAPVLQHGLKRPRFALGCNGQELMGRQWSNERMFTEEGVFAGRDARDLGAEPVRRSWVDPTFLCAPFSVPAPDGQIVIEAMDTFVAGLIVYPKSYRKAFAPYLESLQARRKAYFAQQVYHCLQPTLPRPLGEPTESERKSGVQLLTANPLELSDPNFAPAEKHLIRKGLEAFALSGQTLTLGVGVAALEDLKGLDVDVKRSRKAPVRVTELRSFPVLWRAPLRRAVPYWLDSDRSRSLARGRIAWYLVEIDLPKSARGKDLTVSLRVSAAKRAARTSEIRVLLAPTRMPVLDVCRGVLYPRERESGYLLELSEAPSEADLGTIVLGDYRVLKDYGLTATVIRGVHLIDRGEEPRLYARRAQLRARTITRAGLCHNVPGWLDLSELGASLGSEAAPDPVLLDMVARELGRLRIDLNRMDVRSTAMVAGEESFRGGRPRMSVQGLLAFVEFLRQTGWRDLGVIFDRWHGYGTEGANDDDLVALAGKLDRTVAPESLAVRLRKRWSELAVELLDPEADRFSAGFRLWMGDFNGLWTGNVHRRNLPYLPLTSEGLSVQPLLMPDPGRPAPTLRLLAIREGAVDYAYTQVLARLVERRRKAGPDVDKAKQTLQAVRQAMSDAWDEAKKAASEGEGEPGDRREARRAVPSHAVLDRQRRALFDCIVELGRRR